MSEADEPRGARSRVALFLGTGFGVGYLPILPGTYGTLVALVVVFLFSLTPLPAAPTILGLAVVAIVLCLLIGGIAERALGKKDPQRFVLDEFAGTFVALLRFDGPWPSAAEYVAAFLLFRTFDIIKPPPCRRLQGLKGGLGIVFDDVVAGVYALLGVYVLRDVLRNPPW